MRGVQNLFLVAALGLTLFAVAGCSSPSPASVPTVPPPTLAQSQPTATLPSTGGASTSASSSAAATVTMAPMPAGTPNPAGQATSTVASAMGDHLQPSNPGGPGPAVGLTGNAANGEKLYAQYCAACHGPQGKGGVPNPGSAEGMIPSLNPIDDAMKSDDPKTFATTLDLFIEHGSTPEGPSPVQKMPAWGDPKLLTPQQIADVIAYIVSLNK